MRYLTFPLDDGSILVVTLDGPLSGGGAAVLEGSDFVANLRLAVANRPFLSRLAEALTKDPLPRPTLGDVSQKVRMMMSELGHRETLVIEVGPDDEGWTLKVDTQKGRFIVCADVTGYVFSVKEAPGGNSPSGT